jgi:hypothetical protein
MKQAAAKCLEDGNSRFESVLRSGTISENRDNDHEFCLSFEGGKMPFTYPLVGFVDPEETDEMMVPDMVDLLIQHLHYVDQHGGYIGA